METRKDYEIRQTIELIREYLKMLSFLEDQQTDIADKIPFERMNLELSMAIKNLEYQLEKDKKSVRLTATVWSVSELNELGTKYLPGCTYYVLQDDCFYIRNANHEWIKV